MIVHRSRFSVKRGCMHELVALIKSYAESAGRTVRIYTDNVGPHDTLGCEEEFESLAEREKLLAKWTATPDWPPFVEKFLPLTDRGGTTEIWNLVE